MIKTSGLRKAIRNIVYGERTTLTSSNNNLTSSNNNLTSLNNRRSRSPF